MSVDIEPLLGKLADLAPRFGRAREDIEAMVNRGRTGDYKGVMQNARLVLETILRSMVTDELKQTPGKAMLDELVTKFRQQANAGIIPTNILAHMGTVQAWGNLSSHDHAGSLEDSGVRVGQEEVVGSLNSVVAILTWYADKRAAAGQSSSSTTGSKPALNPVVSSTSGLRPAPQLPTNLRQTNSGIAIPPAAPLAEAAPGGSKVPLIAGGVALVALLGVGGWYATRGNGTTGKTDDPKNPTVQNPTGGDPFAALNGVYKAWDEPLPPAGCRRAEDAAQLAEVVKDADKLALIEKPSAEAAYLHARAAFGQKRKAQSSLDVALACPGFAAAQHLAGMIAITENDVPTARKQLEAARDSAPTWLDNRAKLAGLLLNTDQLDAAKKEIDGLIGAKVDYAPAYTLRAKLRAKEGDQVGMRIDLCQAKSLGSETAANLAKEAKIDCP
ncbi:MAG: hypothetical protein JNM17_10635 [Archangium sp.]|nr:hypothetical protein [Archangium sp.]